MQKLVMFKPVLSNPNDAVNHYAQATKPDSTDNNASTDNNEHRKSTESLNRIPNNEARSSFMYHESIEQDPDAPPVPPKPAASDSSSSSSDDEMQM